MMSGKRALITGGSAGLGAAIASKLAGRGCRCAINYASNEDRARKLLDSLPGSGHVLVKGSMFSRQEAQDVVQNAIHQLGGLDFVASNAGWTKFGEFNDLNSVSDEDWIKCYSTNVQSHLWVMQAAQAELARNQGSFLITASTAGMRPSGSSMAYAVAKAATIHLGASLARALAPSISVNSISPGLLNTDWSKDFTPEQMEGFRSSNALGRLAEVQDVADMAVTVLTSRSITVSQEAVSLAAAAEAFQGP